MLSGRRRNEAIYPVNYAGNILNFFQGIVSNTHNIPFKFFQHLNDVPEIQNNPNF